MGAKDFLRSLVPGNDVAFAAHLAAVEREKAKQAAAKREADRQRNARRHKRSLAK
ncbi:hypothetical protein ACFY64_31650 [Streptomyces collinus]|uniref:hypothetical protein n=1 Tax=Streptomyces collinus TaxID=42684 RepID=UPI0036C53A12